MCDKEPKTPARRWEQRPVGEATFRAMLGEAGIDPNGGFAKFYLRNPGAMGGDPNTAQANIDLAKRLAGMTPHQG